MALGGVDNSIETGGGRATPSAAAASKNIIAIGVSPDGAINTLYQFNSFGAVKPALSRGSTGGPLAEFCAKMLEHGAPTVYAVPIDVTTHTAQSAQTAASTNTGSGVPTLADRPHKALRILCTANGVAGVGAKFKFSSDGGTTNSAEVSWTDSGGGSFVYRPPGWFVTLTFPAANYVATETATFPINSGTRSDSGGWVGNVTAACSVIDDYRPLFEVITGGAWNSGSVVVKPSLDGGITYLPPIAVAASGVFVIPNSGIEVSLAAGTYAAGDVHSWYAAAPTYATGDLTDALTAAMADQSSPQIAMVVCVGVMTDSNAITEGSTLQTYLATARTTYGKQWHLGIASGIACQSAGDVIGGGTAALSARTDAQIRTALLAATETNNVSVHLATQEQSSPLSGLYLRRPISWGVCARYVETEPRIEPAWVASGALDFYTSADFPLHRDEYTASTALHDAKINVLQTRPGRSGAYLAIEQGGAGWRNMSTDASYQSATAVRGLAVMLDAVTTRAQNYIGQDLATNSDGTIAEREAAQIDGELLTVAQRSVGLASGGSFSTPQASSVDVSVDRDSQLGTSPRELVIDYTYQPRGIVTNVNQRVLFSGALSVTG